MGALVSSPTHQGKKMSKHAATPLPLPDEMTVGRGRQSTPPVSDSVLEGTVQEAAPAPAASRTVGTEVRKMFALISIR
jgi:hypothetical protein